jgi:hypothetical protein
MHICIRLLAFNQSRWVAYGHQYFTGNKAEAKAWYHKCIAYDTGRPDCQIFLSRIYLEDSELLVYILNITLLKCDLYVHTCNVCLSSVMYC